MFLIPDTKAVADGEWFPVHSSNIAGIKYDKASRTLTIMFDRSTIYSYEDVSEILYTKMKSATSKGRFYNTYIKGIYNSTRVQ